MSIESPLTRNENSRKRYEEGIINKIIRSYYIFQQGNNQVNSAHSLILGFIALAIALRIEHDYKKLALIGILFIFGTMFIGWLWIKRGKKGFEYMDVMDTTVFGKYGVQMQETNIEQNNKILSLLEEIRDGLIN